MNSLCWTFHLSFRNKAFKAWSWFCPMSVVQTFMALCEFVKIRASCFLECFAYFRKSPRIVYFRFLRFIHPEYVQCTMKQKKNCFAVWRINFELLFKFQRGINFFIKKIQTLYKCKIKKLFYKTMFLRKYIRCLTFFSIDPSNKILNNF